MCIEMRTLAVKSTVDWEIFFVKNILSVAYNDKN